MPGRQQRIEDVTNQNEEEEDILNSEDDDEEDEEGDMDFMDMGGLLSSLLSTEDGDNVCTALIKMTMVMQKQMETQNKILVKILTVMNTVKKDS